MSHLDYDLSVQVAGLIHAHKNQCWRNARIALLHLPGLFLFARYTEGWLVVPDIHEIQIVEHGWMQNGRDRIVDPSVVLLAPKEQSLEYFAGVSVSWFHMREIPLEWPLPLIHLASPRGDGLDHPEYKAAYDAALARAEQLAQESGKLVRTYPKEAQTTVVLDEEGHVIAMLRR